MLKKFFFYLLSIKLKSMGLQHKEELKNQRMIYSAKLFIEMIFMKN